MFRWFEQRLDPYPTDPPQMPPRGLVRFVLHYSRGAMPWLVLWGRSRSAFGWLPLWRR